MHFELIISDQNVVLGYVKKICLFKSTVTTVKIQYKCFKVLIFFFFITDDVTSIRLNTFLSLLLNWNLMTYTAYQIISSDKYA